MKTQLKLLLDFSSYFFCLLCWIFWDWVYFSDTVTYATVFVFVFICFEIKRGCFCYKCKDKGAEIAYVWREPESVTMKSVWITGAVPSSCDDGSWLCNDRWDQFVFVWFCQCPSVGGEDRRNVSTVFWAAVITASLRLWHACCQVCAHCCWQPQGTFTRFWFTRGLFRCTGWVNKTTPMHHFTYKTKIVRVTKNFTYV